MSAGLIDGPVFIVIGSGMAPDAARSTENPRGLAVRGLECLTSSALADRVGAAARVRREAGRRRHRREYSKREAGSEQPAQARPRERSVRRGGADCPRLEPCSRSAPSIGAFDWNRLYISAAARSGAGPYVVSRSGGFQRLDVPSRAARGLHVSAALEGAASVWSEATSREEVPETWWLL
jgi:hypothetical protein